MEIRFTDGTSTNGLVNDQNGQPLHSRQKLKRNMNCI